MPIRMSIPQGRLATALGEDVLFTAALEDTHRSKDAYAGPCSHRP